MNWLTRPFAVLLACVIIGGTQEGGIKGAKRPGPVPTDAFNDRAPAKPKRGGEVTQAMHVNFRVLDYDLDTSAVLSESVEKYLMEALVDNDVETWDYTPKLAERWEIEDVAELKDGELVRGKITPDTDSPGSYQVTRSKEPVIRLIEQDKIKEIRYQTSFTFHLRKGVVFHNGDPFTAKDVEWTYKLLSNPKNGMPGIQGYLAKINECTLIDDYTIRLTYSEQYWMALTAVGGYMKIRPHKAWDPEGILEKDPDAFFKKFSEHPLVMHPIGTGPYEFESFTKDFEIVFKRFEKWWGASHPAPDGAQWPNKIRFRIIRDIIAQLQALKNGEVDYVYQIPPEEFDNFFADPETKKKFAAVEIVYPAFNWYGFNFRKELFRDKAVRWAIAYGSVDNAKFVREVMKGRAELVASPLYLYHPNYNTELTPVPFDLKKAEEILSEAGWWDSDGDGILDRDGQRLEFTVLAPERPPNHPMNPHLLQMQANLRKLGIKMEINKLEWSVFTQKLEKGEFDVCRLAWALSSPPDRQDNFQIWHSSQATDAGSNHIAYSNPEVDDLLVKIRREMDPQKRGEMQLRFQKVLYDDMPYLFLYMPAELRIYNKKWRGARFFVPRPCTSLNEWYLEN